MTSTTDRERLAGLLAVHADHIAAAIRTNAVTALPENKPGMEWAAGLLKLHKANLLADERPAGVELLLDAMLAGLGDQLPASSGGAALLHETADAAEDVAAHMMRGAETERGNGAYEIVALLRRLADEPTVTPPPALTEEGRLRAQVEVLQQDAERDRGLAKVGARCMREGHQGLIEEGRIVIEGWRFALSTALDLDAEAPWEEIHERVKELRRVAAEEQPTETQDGFESRGTAEIQAAALDDAATALDAQSCTCGCRRGAEFLRQRSAVIRAAAARPVVGEQPDTQEAP